MRKEKYVSDVMGSLQKLEHLEWMLANFPDDEGVELVHGKYDRWMGFVQGALWAMDLETIDKFREDVRQGRGLTALKEFFDEI